MRSNLKKWVIKAIAQTQDGENLNGKDDFTQFILDRINYNAFPAYNSDTDDLAGINIEDLIDDFKYTIDQLKRALVPLQEYKNYWDEIAQKEQDHKNWLQTLSIQ